MSFSACKVIPRAGATLLVAALLLGASDLPASRAATVSTEPADITAAPHDGKEAAEAPASATTPLPEIRYGAEGLPKPVARLREQILEAARSGEVEKLLPVLESNEMPPMLSLDTIGDPIDFLKQSSGDAEGRELLAILTEILEAGWVHVDVGTPQEMYVWPYFARYRLDALTPPQLVELYRIVTAADMEEMRAIGVYIFYRVGIGPDGTWHYFVAGE